MNDIPNVPISDFENTLSFPSEETSNVIPAITVLGMLIIVMTHHGESW